MKRRTKFWIGVSLDAAKRNLIKISNKEPGDIDGNIEKYKASSEIWYLCITKITHDHDSCLVGLMSHLLLWSDLRAWYQQNWFFQMLAKLPKTLKTLNLIPVKNQNLLLFTQIHSSSEYIDDDPPFSPKRQKPQNPRAQQNPPVPSSNTNKLPLKSDLPFDFKYSYSETNPEVEPIGFREPKRFSPFGPGRLDRKWTGTTALAPKEVDRVRFEEERNRVLGDPLTEEEIAELVERYRQSDCARQINLGRFSSM